MLSAKIRTESIFSVENDRDDRKRSLKLTFTPYIKDIFLKTFLPPVPL